MLLALVPAMIVMAQPDLGLGARVRRRRARASCSSRARRGGTSRRSRRSARSRSRSCSSRAGGRRRGAQALPGRPPDRVPQPVRRTRGKQGYQQQQSRIAIGSGEKTGRGVTNATQTGLNFLPEHHTDFIFAVVGETFGFAGARPRPLALRAAHMARTTYPHRCEEPVWRVTRRRHHGDAALPDLRKCGYDRGDHADHGSPGTPFELRRLVDARHILGHRPSAIGPRASARHRIVSEGAGHRLNPMRKIPS